MGCLARAGCLLLLVAAGVLAWLNRAAIGHRVGGPIGERIAGQPAESPTGATPSGKKSGTGAEPVATSDWLPLSEAGVKRTSDALSKLSSSRGPVFVTLGGADVASYIFLQVAKQLPASSDSFAARIKEETIGVRATMNTSDLGAPVLGVLGSLLGGRQRVEMDGTLSVVGPGLAEFRVQTVKIRDVSLPTSVISQLVASMVRSRPKGLDENALPVSIPAYIGDVRVAHGKITLYKNVQ